MLVSVTPFSRINDSILWSEHICKIKQDYKQTTIVYDDYDHSSLATQYQFVDIQKSFLYVATETVFNYPHSYLSEKSYKGITIKRPFIIVGAPGSLSLLQSYGFKSFNDWWDESYDSEHDPSRRIEKICAIINNICSLSVDELQTMCADMLPTLEYNFQHYTTFGKNEVSNFDNDCRNLLQN